MSPKTKIAGCIIAVVMLLGWTAIAEVPDEMTYQGRLTDKVGSPLSGSYNIIFKIYATSTTSTSLWSETHYSVPVADGLFEVKLGSTNGLTDDLFSAPDRYLGIQVGTNAEMTPRIKFSSTPYAVTASSLSGGAGSSIELKGTDQTSVSLDPGSGYILRGIDAAGDTRFFLRMPTVDPTLLTLSDPNGEYTDISTGVNAIMIYNENGELRLRIGLDENNPIDGGGAVSFFSSGNGFLSRSAMPVATKQAELTDSGLFLFGASPTDTTMKITADGSIYGKGQVTLGSGSYSEGWTGTTIFGKNNVAHDSLITISGGNFNEAGPGPASVIAGGQWNVAQGYASVIGGGNQNSVYGIYSVVPGGVANSAEGRYSFAAGSFSHADHDGSFVWTDTSDYGSLHSTTGYNQFLIRAAGGVGIGTNAPAAQLHSKSTGLYAGKFECDTSSALASVVHAQYYGTGSYDATAVYGKSTPTDNYGYGGKFYGGYRGVYGNSTGTGSATYSGVYGYSSNTGSGTAIGLYGYATGGAYRYGVYGFVTSGTGSAYAGYFSGNAHVTGTFTAGTKSFKIDHPLDPANKFLQHACVESSEMKNIYDGVVSLNGSGEAVVVLPDYFNALNRDFRYQLTCIGGYAPVYVAEKIRGSSFRIAGGQPGMEVSWQVTGVRKDAYALKNPMIVEQEKSVEERGKYLHPTAFDRPESDGIDAAREKEISEREASEDR